MPKPGRPRNKIESDCPFSVLKVYYKAIAKLLSNKLGRCVHEHILNTQFGFISTCTVAETSTYLQTIFNRARRTGEPIQTVFFGGKSCF